MFDEIEDKQSFTVANGETLQAFKRGKSKVQAKDATGKMMHEVCTGFVEEAFQHGERSERRSSVKIIKTKDL